MKKNLRLLFAVMGLLVAFSCRNGGGERTGRAVERADSAAHEAAAKERPDSTALRVALLPTADCLPLYYAARSGLFDSLKVKVVLRSFEAQADCDTALLGSSADISASNLATALLQYARSPETALLMRTQGRWSVAVSGVLRIKKPDLLKHRMIAVARNSASDQVSAEVMEKAGLGYDDAFRPQINSLPLRAAMLDNNQVDAAALPEPWSSAARAAGHRVVFASEAQPGCIVVKKSILSDKGKTETLRRFVRAYNAAVSALNKKGKAAVRTVLLKDYKLTPAAVDSFKLPAYVAAEAPKPEEADRALRFLKSRGLVDKKFTGKGMNQHELLK